MKKIIIIAGLFLISLGAVFAQATASHDIDITVAEVVYLELEDSTTISLTTAGTYAAGDAGLSEVGNPDSTKRLFYTSIVSAAETRTITAQISAGTVPTGLDLLLVAAVEAGGGTESAERTLDGTAQTIVTAIGSYATGRTGSDGAELTYRLSISNPTLLVASGTAATVTILLTLTDS